MKYVVIGLGNPEEEYGTTRHNAGKMLIDYAQGALDFSEWKENKKLKVMESTGKIGKHSATLLSPLVFMNLNGQVLKGRFLTKKDVERLVVIHDDLDLPLGRIKISFGRGTGGHNGVESVVKSVKSKDFIRVRIGVANTTSKGVVKKPVGEEAIIKFLVGKCKTEDFEVLKKLRKTVAEVVETIIAEGYVTAMNKFN